MPIDPFSGEIVDGSLPLSETLIHRCDMSVLDMKDGDICFIDFTGLWANSRDGQLWVNSKFAIKPVTDMQPDADLDGLVRLLRYKGELVADVSFIARMFLEVYGNTERLKFPSCPRSRVTELEECSLPITGSVIIEPFQLEMLNVHWEELYGSNLLEGIEITIYEDNEGSEGDL